jgi:hypothetical protein
MDGAEREPKTKTKKNRRRLLRSGTRNKTKREKPAKSGILGIGSLEHWKKRPSGN